MCEAAEQSSLSDRIKNWWLFLDYGDGNWIAILGASESCRIVDVFHETAGEPGSHSVISSTIEGFSERLIEERVFWLEEGFRPLGII